MLYNNYVLDCYFFYKLYKCKNESISISLEGVSGVDPVVCFIVLENS